METAELVVYSRQGIRALKAARSKLDLVIEQMEKAEGTKDRGELVHAFALWGAFMMGFMQKTQSVMGDVARAGGDGLLRHSEEKEEKPRPAAPPIRQVPRLMVCPPDRDFTEEEKKAADAEATRILDGLQKQAGDIVH